MTYSPGGPPAPAAALLSLGERTSHLFAPEEIKDMPPQNMPLGYAGYLS